MSFDKYERSKLSNIPNQMLPGAIALILLLIYYTYNLHADIFFNWLVENAISFIIAALFIRVITNAVINRRLNPKDYKLLAIGIIIFIPYYFYTSMTLEFLILAFLEAIVFLSFYEAIISIVREAID